jgi:hypothetical protein
MIIDHRHKYFKLERHMTVEELFEHLDIVLHERRPSPGSHVVAVTGRMAQAGLERMFEAIAPEDFSWEIRVMPVEVAAWLTTQQVAQEFGPTQGVDIVLLPGRSQVDPDQLQQMLGVAVARGPDCYSELPVFLEEARIVDVEQLPQPRVMIAAPAGAELAQGISDYYGQPVHDLNRIPGWPVIRANRAAEHVRVSQIDPASSLGWIVVGWPRQVQDVIWISRLPQQPDIVLVTDQTDPALITELEKMMQPVRRVDPMNMPAVLVAIEQLMQTCVVPDAGLATEPK